MNALPYLQRYLSHSNWLALVQLMIFAAIIYLVAERTVRSVGMLRPVVAGPVANGLAENLARLCMGLGLLLTFSGLYSYMAAGSTGDQGPLLLALGSSAIGYSAWTVCAAAAVIDDCVAAYQPESPFIEAANISLSSRGHSHEQESDVDSRRRRRYLGGVTDHANQEDDTALGSLDGYQRRESGGEPESDELDSDLDDEEWGYRLLVGEEPPADAAAGE